MKHTIIGLTLLSVLAATAPASASPDPIREHIKKELPYYGFRDVDVDGLTSAQVAHINYLLHSNNSASGIKGGIGAVLGDSIINLFKK